MYNQVAGAMLPELQGSKGKRWSLVKEVFRRRTHQADPRQPVEVRADAPIGAIFQRPEHVLYIALCACRSRHI